MSSIFQKRGLEESKCIIRYIYNKPRTLNMKTVDGEWVDVLLEDKKKIGMLIAIGHYSSTEAKTPEYFTIGWAKCHAIEKFDRERAFDIAIGRAMTGADIAESPKSYKKKIVEFHERAEKYFYKNAVVK